MLFRSQSELRVAVEDSTNPHYKSKYASLPSVLNAIRTPLHKWGLIITQTTDYDDTRIILVTTLIHESGQSISTKLPLILGRDDMQGLGGAITYARRYSIVSLLVIQIGRAHV